MKIIHEIRDVQIVPYRTIDEALVAGFGKYSLYRVLNALPHRRTQMFDEESELSGILRQSLWRGSEGGQTYTRTLALASLDREMGIHEFFSVLAERNYYPAGISEGMSYLPRLVARGVEADFIFHLGTALRTEKFTEQRLLTKKNGGVELIPFYHATKLKPHYIIVVVKEEKKPLQK